MSRFINPFTDVGFKRIFGQEINKDLLIDFLNDLLDGEKHIVDIRFLDKEILPEFMHDRGVIYDIYCTNESGEQFIVEMQNRQQVNFRERALYYLSRAVARQGERGAEWQFGLKAVYGVFFMNFRWEDGPHKLRTDIVLSDRETHEAFSDKLRFIFLELPSFVKEEHECKTDFERWIYVLKNMDTLQRLPFKARKSVFEKLEKIVDIAALSKEDRMKYDESIKIYRDHLAVEAYAREREERRTKEAMERGHAEGRAEGMAQGRAEGMAQGRAEGMAQGRAEGIATGERAMSMQIARRMKEKGMSEDDICQLTGLSSEDFRNL